MMSRIALLLLLFCVTDSSFSQFENFGESWRWVKFTTESGLPSNQINEIEETPDGTVWVSTPLGVAWFDGYRWHHMDSSKGLPEKPASIRINDSTGQVLVITDQRLFLGGQSGFHSLSLENNGSPLKVMNAYFFDRDRILLVAEYLSQYNFLIHDDGTLVPFETPHNSPQGRIIDLRSFLWKTAAGNFWFMGWGGLYLYSDSVWKLTIGNTLHKGSLRINAIVENRQGRGIASSNLDSESGIWEWTRWEPPRLSATEQTPLARAIDISSSEDIAVVAYESGELRVRKDGRWQSMNSPFAEIRGTLAVKFRENGDLWFGTTNGLYLFRASSKRWVNRKHTFGDQKNIINDICLATDGTLWVATQSGVEAHSTDGQIRQFSGASEVSFTAVTGINEDVQGNVWIGSGSSFTGAFRWDGNSWKHVGKKQGLAAPHVHKIKKDRKGDLWFLGLGKTYTDTSQPGAFQYTGGRFIQWGEREGLLSGRVYSFAEDSSLGRWFGTNKGLSHWNNGVWTYWRTMEDLKLSAGVYSIAIDAEQQVWCADRNWVAPVQAGIRVVNQDGSIQLLEADWKLFDNEIVDLKLSPNQLLWLATSKGLYAYDKGVWLTFDYLTGLSTPRLNCVLPLEDKVYVGSPGGGLSVLSLAETNQPTRIEFDRTVIEDETAFLRWRTYAYWGNLPPSEIETRYRLDDGHWSAWSKTKEVSIPDLDEGDHSFTVQAKDLFGSYDLDGQQITFLIKPPYYKRLEYNLPLLALLLVVTFLFVNGYMRKRNFRRELQQHRDRIASDLHDEVGSNLGSIALISQHLQKKTTIPSKHRLEMADVSRMALHTAETLREIVWYINPSYDTLENLILRMRETAALMLKRVEYTFLVTEGVFTDDMLRLETRRHMYLSFKEILHNIVKHSQATRVDVKVVVEKSRIAVHVRDNGIGFETRHNGSGEGLKNLAKRAQMLGGELHIESSRGQGAMIMFSVKTT